jgi:hypothetical protein
MTEFLPVASVAAILIGIPILAVGTRNALRSNGARAQARILSLSLLLAATSSLVATVATRSPVLLAVGLGTLVLGSLATPLLIRLTGGPDPVFMTRRDAAHFFALLKESTDNPDRLPAAFEVARKLDNWRTPVTAPLIDAVQAVGAELAANGRTRDAMLAGLYERVAHATDEIKRTAPSRF